MTFLRVSFSFFFLTNPNAMKIILCSFLSNSLLEGRWNRTLRASDVGTYLRLNAHNIMFIVIIICILAAIRTRQTQKVNSFKVVFSLRNKTIYLFFNYFLCTVGIWAASVWLFCYIIHTYKSGHGIKRKK